MKTVPILLMLAVTSACGGTKDAAVDSAAAAPVASADPAPAPPAARTVADFAGTWQLTSNVQGAAKPVSSTLMSGPDTWTLTLEGRPGMQVQVSMSGDSLITQSPEYGSVLRKGVKVTTRTAAVMNGETMSGNMEATYKTSKGEEKVPGTITGTRTAK